MTFRFVATWLPASSESFYYRFYFVLFCVCVCLSKISVDGFTTRLLWGNDYNEHEQSSCNGYNFFAFVQYTGQSTLRIIISVDTVAMLFDLVSLQFIIIILILTSVHVIRTVHGEYFIWCSHEQIVLVVYSKLIYVRPAIHFVTLSRRAAAKPSQRQEKK